MTKISPLLGILVFLCISYLWSEDRRKIRLKTAGIGLLLQIGFAFVMLKTPVGLWIFQGANNAFLKLKEYSDQGARTLFGSLTTSDSLGTSLAFSSLPLIIFVSALMGVLVYFGVIQFLIRQFARLFYRTLRITGVEAFTSSLLMFMGIETFTGVKKYLDRMNRSQLFTVMTVYMATIAGSVMAVYTGFGAQAGHLFTASLMSIPAAFVIAKLMIPDDAIKREETIDHLTIQRKEKNLLQAMANGTSDGLQLALQVGAMIIAFVAVIFLFEDIIGLSGLRLQPLLGYLFSPFAWLMGIPAGEARAVGNLLGIKTFFNEFLAYLNLKSLIDTGGLSPRTVSIATYALCGFANFGSVGIILGGIRSIAPKQLKTASSLALKSLVAGTLATFMTAALVSFFV